MRLKTIFLFLLIGAPLLIIAFLYQFGENQYVIRGSRLAGKTLPHLQGRLRSNSGATLVGLRKGGSEAATMQSRVESRVLRIQKEDGLLTLVYVDTLNDADTSSTTAKALLHDDLGLPADTGGESFWYLLVDAQGKLLNAYDLRQQRLLDTLAIEATIASQQKH